MRFFFHRLRAFVYAFSGIWQALRSEIHLKIHIAIAFFVIACGFVVRLSALEWLMILGCITLVISLEMINSAVEKLCDRLVPERDPKIKYVKDVCAGAVLLASIFAILAGLVVFLPHLAELYAQLSRHK